MIDDKTFMGVIVKAWPLYVARKGQGHTSFMCMAVAEVERSGGVLTSLALDVTARITSMIEGRVTLATYLAEERGVRDGLRIHFAVEAAALFWQILVEVWEDSETMLDVDAVVLEMAYRRPDLFEDDALAKLIMENPDYFEESDHV